MGFRKKSIGNRKPSQHKLRKIKVEEAAAAAAASATVATAATAAAAAATAAAGTVPTVLEKQQLSSDEMSQRVKEEALVLATTPATSDAETVTKVTAMTTSSTVWAMATEKFTTTAS